MLRNTGCRSVSTAAFLLLGCSGMAAAATEELEEVVVHGRTEKFYRIDDNAMGTKTPTSFLDIPQSVQMLSRQLIEDQAATRITDLYRSISGVNEFSYAGFSIRGFRQEDEVKYDGVAGDPFAGFAIPQLFNIERVEILKGPSSMLYGAAEPGGLINYVTKKPTHEVKSNVTLFGGNYEQYGASGEYSGPVNDADTVRMRVGGYSQQKKPWRNGSSERNTILDASLDFDLGSPQTTLLLQGTYVDQLMGGQRFRPIPSDANGNFRADRSWNAAEPTDVQILEAKVFMARLQHEAANGLHSTATLRYVDNEAQHRFHDTRGSVDKNADGILDSERRQFRDQKRTKEIYSFTSDNYFTTELVGMKHLVLFGGDYVTTDAVENNRLTPDFPIADALSFVNPVYGNVNMTVINQQLATNPAFTLDGTDKKYGFFLQDQVTFTDWFEAVLGLRYDHFDTTEDRGAPTGPTSAEFTDSALTARGGLIFRLSKDISSYASYSQGFQPQSVGNQGAVNGPFDPLEGESYEVGIKGDLGGIQASLAAYQITKQNMLQRDTRPGVPPDTFVTLGEVESRGIELDFMGDLTERWVLMVNYAYNETEITQGLTGVAFSGVGLGNLTGDRFVNAPENRAGVWTRFEFPGIASSIGAGLDYVDDRINNDRNPVPAYTIYDLSWQTKWKNLDFQLNVRNVTDKEYAVSGFQRGNFPGEPRTFLFQVSVDLSNN